MGKNDGGPAFPWGEHGTHLGGASLRDYFASHAPVPPAWWLKDWANGRQLDLDADIYASWSWAYADAMLKSRDT